MEPKSRGAVKDAWGTTGEQPKDTCSSLSMKCWVTDFQHLEISEISGRFLYKERTTYLKARSPKII